MNLIDDNAKFKHLMYFYNKSATTSITKFHFDFSEGMNIALPINENPTVTWFFVHLMYLENFALLAGWDNQTLLEDFLKDMEMAEYEQLFIDNPDKHWFKKLIQTNGKMVFVPPYWGHVVETVGISIKLAWDYVNISNIGCYIYADEINLKLATSKQIDYCNYEEILMTEIIKMHDSENAQII